MDRHLIFATSTEIVRVPPDSVVFISADGNYSAITLADGESFVLTLQLGQIERRIASMLVADDNDLSASAKALLSTAIISLLSTPRARK